MRLQPARHATQGGGIDLARIGGKQNPRGRLRHVEGQRQQRLGIPFDPEHPSLRVAGKRGRIENDRIEFFAAAREPRQHGKNIVRDEAVPRRLEAIQREILPSAIARPARAVRQPSTSCWR